MKHNRLTVITAAALIIFLSAPVSAQPGNRPKPVPGSPPARIHIVVKTIFACQGKPFMDPRLADLGREFQSVFKYSSYRLLAQNSMNPAIGQSGTSPLPDRRTIIITPMEISGNRAHLKLEIQQDRRQIFQTVIQLMNRGAVTVGGPRHDDGVLLFNISNSF